MEVRREDKGKAVMSIDSALAENALRIIIELQLNILCC